LNSRRTLSRFLPLLALALWGLSPEGTARAGSITYLVTANTTSLNGTSGYLDFQLNPNMSTAASASATITNFTGDGTLGAELPPLGDVSGTLPGTVSFTNGPPPNDYTQASTYGNSLSFDVTLSGAAVGGSAPAGSTFAFSLLDSSGNPYSTGPNGATVTIDINPSGTTTSTSYPPASGGGPTATASLVTAVPEPATLWSMSLGLGTLLGWCALRHRRASAA
jgi:hypothetical protein